MTDQKIEPWAAGKSMPIEVAMNRTIGFLEGLADDLSHLSEDRASRCRGFAQCLKHTMKERVAPLAGVIEAAERVADQPQPRDRVMRRVHDLRAKLRKLNAEQPGEP